MPAMPPPVADERAGLEEYLAAAAVRVPRDRLRAHRRAGPVHAVGQRAVDRRADQARHGLPEAAGWSASRAAPDCRRTTSARWRSSQRTTQDEFVMRDDETLAGRPGRASTRRTPRRCA